LDETTLRRDDWVDRWRIGVSPPDWRLVGQNDPNESRGGSRPAAAHELIPGLDRKDRRATEFYVSVLPNNVSR
jgi:hypothetical protein